MNIRKIQIQELLPALHLAAEVFAEDVAPAYTDEGVGRFHEFISYDSFREMFERQEVTIFGAFEDLWNDRSYKQRAHQSVLCTKGISKTRYRTYALSGSCCICGKRSAYF